MEWVKKLLFNLIFINFFLENKKEFRLENLHCILFVDEFHQKVVFLFVWMWERIEKKMWKMSLILGSEKRERQERNTANSWTSLSRRQTNYSTFLSSNSKILALKMLLIFSKGTKTITVFSMTTFKVPIFTFQNYQIFFLKPSSFQYKL